MYSRLLYPSDADLYPHTGLCSHGISCISSLSLCKYPVRFLNPLSMLFLQIFWKMLGTKQLLLTTNLHSRKKNTMEINGYQQLFGTQHSLKYLLCWTDEEFSFWGEVRASCFFRNYLFVYLRLLANFLHTIIGRFYVQTWSWQLTPSLLCRTGAQGDDAAL